MSTAQAHRFSVTDHTAATLPTLPLARLTFTARANQPMTLPPFAGSMLRGAFGHALLSFSPLPHANQQPCALSGRCPYCQIFAPPPIEHVLQKFSHMPAPYIIEPDALPQGTLPARTTWHFQLVLVGRALEHLPIIIRAFEVALKKGLGRQHTPCELLAVTQQDSLIWCSDKRQCHPVQPFQPAVSQSGERAQLHFHTPLHIRQQGRPAGQRSLTARSFLMTLARRYQLMADTQLGNHAPQLNFPYLNDASESVHLQADNMQWQGFGRYSSRQQSRQKLAGLTGTVTLQGNLTPFAQLLHLGQWLHIGKQTVFGLGRYDLNWPDASP